MNCFNFIAKQNTPPLGAKLADRPARVTLFLVGEPEGQNPVMPRPLAAGIGILSLPSLLAGMPEKKASKAASPPAEAPMPTIGKLG